MPIKWSDSFARNCSGGKKSLHKRFPMNKIGFFLEHSGAKVFYNSREDLGLMGNFFCSIIE